MEEGVCEASALEGTGGHKKSLLPQEKAQVLKITQRCFIF